jgi:hypothetical protein
MMLPPGLGGAIVSGAGGFFGAGGSSASGGAAMSQGGVAGSSSNTDAGVVDGGSDAAPYDAGRGPDATTEGDATTHDSGLK